MVENFFFQSHRVINQAENVLLVIVMSCLEFYAI